MVDQLVLLVVVGLQQSINLLTDLHAEVCQFFIPKQCELFEFLTVEVIDLLHLLEMLVLHILGDHVLGPHVDHVDVLDLLLGLREVFVLSVELSDLVEVRDQVADVVFRFFKRLVLLKVDLVLRKHVGRRRDVLNGLVFFLDVTTIFVIGG